MPDTAPRTSARLRLAAFATEPLVIVALGVIISVALANLIGGAIATSVAILVWLTMPCLVVLILSAAAKPVARKPKSLLTAEAGSHVRFFGSSFGLIAAGLVAAMSAFAVQRDLSRPSTGSSQIWEFAVVVGAAVLIVGSIRVIWLYSARLLVAGVAVRRAAVRTAAANVVLWKEARKSLSVLRRPAFKRWQAFLADSTVPLAAILCIPCAAPVCAFLVGWATGVVERGGS